VANKKSAITTFWLSATYFGNNKKGIRPIGHNVMEIDKALNDEAFFSVNLLDLLDLIDNNNKVSQEDLKFSEGKNTFKLHLNKVVSSRVQKAIEETIKSAESKRKTIGSNEYKNNPTSNKCPFLKINSTSTTHDSTIFNLCISAAFVARGLAVEKCDDLYSAVYTQLGETSKNLNAKSTSLFTKNNIIKRITSALKKPSGIKKYFI
ncbi:246_t:CDS:2, partial [Entrophospora sp. SA101]